MCPAKKGDDAGYAKISGAIAPVKPMLKPIENRLARLIK
jgi:hypothetical protein